MGEVYRARDTRLGRVVAIKVILEAYASDPERAARFQREAKMLAALNHPRIAALYGLEQADGVHFLVMELVEGETLAERIARGPLQVEEAIGISLQIAEALEAAHEKGVIHRDLKPANVKITPDQQVKVLDFGLAKAVESDAAVPEAANSPTLSMLATQAGIILGTAAYMSPEQAKGLAVDHRSDVFSFGTVLFEMLTGRQPFRGDTAADVLASVLVREAEISGLPADTNPRLIELVARCLQKNPKRRWQHIGDVRAELEALAAAPRSMLTAAFAPAVPRPLWKRAIVPAACAVAAAALAGFAVWSRTPVAARPVVTFAHVLPEDQTFTNGGRPLLAISPDGGTLVYVANRRLYRRVLADLQAEPIPGFDGKQAVTTPAISPDGQAVVFFSGGDDSLKRIPVAGGSAHTLAAAKNPNGIDWSRWGIVYSQPDGEIMRLPDAGGQPEVLVPAKAGEQTHMPQMLSDDLVLYSVARGLDSERWAAAKVVVRSLRTGVTTTLIEGGSAARYVASGHLLYAVDNTYFARLFDIDTLEVRGAPIPVLEGVARSSSSQSGAAQLAVSATGALVYVPGTFDVDERAWTIVAADRTGKLTPLKAPPADYGAPRVSPDGRRVALDAREGTQLAVLVYDLSGETAIRRVTLEGNNRHPIWSADSARVTFQSDREGDEAIFWQDANGTSAAERLTRPGPTERHVPESWSPDGQTLLVDVVNNQQHVLWTFSLRDRKLTRFVDGARVPMRASFSPDGKWVVYMTGRDGTAVLQVQPFPATGAKHELRATAADEGPPHDPVWARNGRELFFIKGRDLFWTVPIITSPAFTFGNATSFPRNVITAGPSIRGQYDVTPDGRFIGTVRQQPTAPAAAAGAAPVRPVQQITVVLNWVERLKSLVPLR